ncbi:MAG: tRNA (adenosine(37)-N6)-threonylcarbamoyltransferase complex dimerization subunit type 1 TsaB [Bacteroidales bacterium]|nr:tRNA (adenosine(37)-N6)-threonylcarbamoyltransferase complex dimerization subunit type 1 TsaB [Bacteroidales bacterium]
MPNILLLETATPVCSVAIAEGGKVVASRKSAEPNAHSSKLAVFVDEVMKEWGMGMSSLDAVCVSSGPGSYTGLRIGVFTAKGLCYALDKPLIAVETLQGMANLFLMQNHDFDGFVCPMIDARRMEVYTAMFDNTGARLEPTTAEVIGPESFGGYLAKGDVAFVGDGADKTKEILGAYPNAVYGLPFEFSAQGLLAEAHRRYTEGIFEDVAYFEPFYLKDFVAKKPVVKGLGKMES